MRTDAQRIDAMRTEVLRIRTVLCCIAAGALLAIGCDDPQGDDTHSDPTQGDQTPAEGDTERDDDSITVQLCDGESTVEVPADGERDAAGGRAIAAALMAQWQERNPDEKWGEDEPAHAIVEPYENTDIIAEPNPEDAEETATGQGHQAPVPTQGAATVYGAHTAREVALWDREVRLAVAEGGRVFHNGDLLGSTIAVSCDMCHPNGANTHPETYPKYQVQLGRVALLRDMVNWCLEHPVRAEPMEADDPRMRAMEAYMYAQRRGHELNYGRR
jgi:hypothetical protein